MAAKADYGIDAPPTVRGLLSRGLMLLVGGLGAFALLSKSKPGMAVALLRAGLWMGGAQIAMGWLMIWSSRAGKLRLARKLVDWLPWRGDEQVLDVGCGRGTAMIMAAKRLQSGTVTGVDIWKAEDLTGNQMEATLENARIEGVAERVKVETADARDLPFPDDFFDTVISMTTLHNIEKAGDRRRALAEMLRVLKAGGHLAIYDILHAGSYLGILRDLGAADVQRSGLILLWGLPGYRIKARKV